MEGIEGYQAKTYMVNGSGRRYSEAGILTKYEGDDMKSSIVKVAFFVSTLSVGIAAADSVQTSPETATAKYVQASRVALRQSPMLGAEVLQYLPTNTIVMVNSAEGDWCSVSVQRPSSNGFVACRFLSEKQRLLSQIEDELAARTSDPKIRLDLLQQRFWVSPSAQNLIAYGDALNMQKSPTRSSVTPSKRPEYEAMKEFLSKGWHPKEFELPIDGLASKSNNKSTRFPKLPAISISLFNDSYPCLLLGPYIGFMNQERGTNIVYLSDAGQAERCAARSSFIDQLRVLNFGAPHVGVYSDQIYASWDVGGYTVQFGDGMPFVGVMPDGSSFNGKALRASTEGVIQEAECDQIGEQIILDAEIEKNIRKLGALFLLVEPSTVGVNSVKVLRSNYRQHVIKPDNAYVDEAYMADFAPQKFSIALDFNDDKTADIAVVGEELGQNDISTGPNYKRRFTVYINANGVWKMYGEFSPKVCEGG